MDATTGNNCLSKSCHAFFRWSLITAFAGALIILVGHYLLTTQLDQQIQRRLQRMLEERYPEFHADVGAVKRVEWKGLRVWNITLAQRHQPGVTPSQAPLIQIGEAAISCNTSLESFLAGNVQLKHVTLRRVSARCVQLADGSWSLSQLLRDKADSTNQSTLPPITILDSSLTLHSPKWLGEQPLTIQNIAAHVDQSTPQLFRLKGKCNSPRFQNLEFRGTVNPVTQVVSIEAKIDGLDADDQALRPFLEQSTQNRELLSSRFRGEIHAGLSARVPLKDIRASRFAVKGNIKNGHFVHQRLPYPLSDFSGRFSIGDGGFSLTEANAWCGAARVSISWRGNGFSPTATQTLNASARNVSLEHGWTRLAPDKLNIAWQKMSPLGKVHVELTHRINPPPSEYVQPGSHVVIELDNTSFEYESFPYRLNGATGKLVLADGTMNLVGVKAFAGGQVVRLYGQVSNLGRNWHGWMKVNTDGPIPLDRAFFRAIASNSPRLGKTLNPSGWITLEHFEIKRDPGSRLTKRDVRINLNDCTVSYAKFPYPISKIEGRLTLKNDQWKLHDVQGLHGGTFIQCKGGWASGPFRDLDLEFIALDVALDEDLRVALATLNPPAGKFWEDIRPRGAIDHLSVRLKPNATGRIEMFAELQKWQRESNALVVHPNWFPYTLNSVTGRFAVTKHGIKLSDVQAEHNGTRIRLDGQFLSGRAAKQVGSDVMWEMRLPQLHVDNLKFDHDLFTAVPAGLRKGLKSLAPTGSTVMNGSVVIRRRSTRSQPEMQWHLKVDATDADVTLSDRIEHIFGGVELNGHMIDGDFACRGYVSLDSAFVKGKQLTKIRGPVWIGDNQLLVGRWADWDRGIEAERLTANFLGGQLVMDARVIHDDVSTFRLECELQQASLAKLAQDHSSGKAVSGIVTGKLGLFGQLGRRRTWQGNGELHFYDADVYELPVMVALLKILSIRPPDTSAFTTGDIAFHIRNELIQLDQINFNGDVISLRGKGWLDFEQQLHISFYTLVGRNDRWIPFVAKLLREASRNLLEIEVQGTLQQPEVYRTALPELDGTMQRLMSDLELQNGAISKLREARAKRSSSFPFGWLR